MRFFVALVNLIQAPKLPLTSLQNFPYLSILIPVRNEAENLPNLFKVLSNINYPLLEIIALNDHSEDETESLLQGYALSHGNFRYVNSKSLPEGWLGKNWACHQLGNEAKGDYYLFLDADLISMNNSLIPRVIAQSQKLDLSLLSIFPYQVMLTRGEKTVVPIMHYLLLSLLPLWSIYRLPFPSLAAANGQFMLFKARNYRRYNWHSLVKNVVVEDIEIMREVKKAGLKGMTFVGSELVKVRMYKGFKEGINGFSKNLLAGFGNSILGLWVYLILVVLGWAVAFFTLEWPLLMTSLVLALSVRIMISYLANQNPWNNTLFHFNQMCVMLWIGVLSTVKKIRKKNEWKGRNVQL
ncbi:MAG: glycosyltransferase family 2 protein [Bacteroidia bacterium]|nr:glycosyltransferase family 2 protein [Bacteroidia bacterium]